MLNNNSKTDELITVYTLYYLMIHEILKIFHHNLLKHVQVRNHDMWLLSDIVSV